MKRLFPVLLVLLLISCMVVPASASTVDAIEDQNFWLMGDLDWFDDAEGALGAIYNTILDVVDRLDWLDSTMRDVETEIIFGVKDLLSPLTNIAQRVEDIYNYLGLYFGMKWSEDIEIRDEADDKETEIDDVTDIFATAPTIDQDAIDGVISDVGGQFENITSDENGLVLFGALGDIADSEIGRHVIPTSAMLGVLSFILFGKVF